MENKALIARLRKVPDCYEDFVKGTMTMVISEPNIRAEIEQYLEYNPNAMTDDIIEKITDLLGM